MDEADPLRLDVPAAVAEFLRDGRVGRLATADAAGRPLVVPVCYVFDGRRCYSAIDAKPKRTAKLRRLRNIAENPRVSLVVDHYDEDWSRLRFVAVRGRGRILHSGREHARGIRLLRRKYVQYRAMRLEERPLLKIVPWKVFAWEAS